MGLDVTLAQVDCLQRAVKAMKFVSAQGFMRMSPNSLVFGVNKNTHNVPAVLRLADFQRFRLTGPGFQNATVEINFNELDVILESFAYDEPLRFFIKDFNTNVIHFRIRLFDGPGGLTRTPLNAPPIQVLPPFMGNQFHRGLRPFKFALRAIQFLEPLIHCVHYRVPLTLVGWRYLVMIIAGNRQGRYVYMNYNHTNPNPPRSYCRFHLSLQSAVYILKACESDYNPWICFHTQDPAVDPNLPPVISVPLDDNTHLVFYLQFNSIAEPQVYVHNP